MVLLITFSILLAVVFGRSQNHHTGPEVLITAGAYFSGITIALTAALSAAALLKPIPTNLAWTAVAALLAITNLKHLRAAFTQLKNPASRPSLHFRWTALIISVFAAGTLLSGLLYPVRNWDSLWHIMPRITFWLQQGSYTPFSTPVGQQLTTYPLSAWLIAHVKLTTGGSDLFVELVQWCAYLCSIYLASHVAKLLGASKRGRRWVALLVATTPMALLQATTTQYDLLVGTYALATIYLIMSLIVKRLDTLEPRKLLANTITLALLISAGLNAKVTYAFMIIPFAVWLGIRGIRELPLRSLIKHVSMVLLIVFVLALPWFGLNYIVNNGDILGVQVKGNSHILISDRSFAGITTNTIRGITTPLGTPVAGVNSILEHSVEKVTLLVGLDLDSPVNREIKEQPYQLSAQVTNNDLAPYPITLAALALALVLLLTHRFSTRKILVAYITCALFSYFAISGLVSWQPYIVRTLVGPVLIALPLVGAVEPHLKRLGRLAMSTLVMASCLLGLLVLLWNSSAPLLPQTYRPLSPGESLGYWNATQQHLQFAYSLPEVEPLAERLIADAGTRTTTLAVGGSQADGFPFYVLMRPLKNTTFSYRDDIDQATEDYLIEILLPSEFDSADHTVPSGYTLFGEQHYQSGEKYVIAIYKKATN